MTLIFKFGGASVKDANSVRNLAKIVSSYDDRLVIVVSAMDKITRALTEIIDNYVVWKDHDVEFKEVIRFHHDIIKDLFEDKSRSIILGFNEISLKLLTLLGKPPKEEYGYNYDQIVAYGELFATFIVSQYLNHVGCKNKWVDARKLIKTDASYRDAKVDWTESASNMNGTFNFEEDKIYLTQGFIASNKEGRTTTLGLEGSDYSAAIIAYLLDADKVIVWKDVAGVFNSDPSEVDDVVKLDAISYREAVELAYYGAKIIHYKTIKPLQNKEIPLYVKSFLAPDDEGTLISETTPNKLGVVPEVPIFISKKNQILISIAPKDFSFIAEECLKTIFSVFAKFKVKVNLMQNSAVSFSACVDNNPERVIQAIRELREDYKVRYNDELTLVTIRHYTPEIIESITKDRKIFVQQKSRHTVRFVLS